MKRSKSSMPSSSRSLAAIAAASGHVVLSLAMGGALAACGSAIGTVSYEARQPTRAPVARGQVAIYDVDCRDPTQNITDCTYNGSLVGWQVLGVFHTPSKAASESKWGKYRAHVHEMAASRGCPAVAVRRYPPAGPNEPIGAFCVDTNPASMLGVPAIGIPAVAPVTSPTRECNSDSECAPGVKCMRGTCRNS